MKQVGYTCRVDIELLQNTGSKLDFSNNGLTFENLTSKIVKNKINEINWEYRELIAKGDEKSSNKQQAILAPFLGSTYSDPCHLSPY